MKKIVLFILFICCYTIYSQVNPTLGIGLETLTLNKGTIDVEVLTKVILKKQKELKNEALKRFMLKMFPDNNYTTRFYVQNCLNILLNEKNPQVIEKEILELTTNYAIALGVTKAVNGMNDSIFKTDLPRNKKQNDYQKLFKELKNDSKISTLKNRINIKNEESKRLENLYANLNSINNKIKIYKNDLEYFKFKNIAKDTIKIIQNYATIHKIICRIIYNNETFKTRFLNKHESLELNINKKKFNSDTILTNIKKIESNYIKYAKKRIKNFARIETKLKRTQRRLMRNNVNYDYKDILNENNVITEVLNFGEKLDIVSLALSENELLKKKGFFKNKIDYTEDQNYFYSQSKDKAIIDSINKKINPFIENYDVIKNFLENVDTKNFNKISDELKKIYLNQLNFENFSIYIKDDDIKNNFNENVKKLENLLFLKEEYLKLNEFKNSIKYLDSYEIIKDLELIDNLIQNYNNFNSRVDSLNKNIEDRKISKELELNNTIISDSKEKGTIKNSFLNILSKDVKQIKHLKEEIIIIINSNIKQTDSITNIIKKKENELDILIGKYNSEKLNPELLMIKESLKKFDLNQKNKIVEYIIDTIQKDISKSHIFFDVFINKLIEKIENNSFEFKQDVKTTVKVKPVINSESNLQEADSNSKDLAVLIAKIYERLIFFKNNKNYTISDINYLENELLSQLVGLKYIDINKNQTIYNELIKGIKNLTPLLKIRILFFKNLDITSNNYTNVISLFEFIGNLDKLDKAQTYASIVDLIKTNSEEINKVLPDGEFKEGYMLFINGVKKYTLINPNAEKQYVEIDVVSFLDDMQQHYQRNNPSNFSLYLSVGLNQNMFINKFQFSDTNETLSTVGFASEKIGLKLKLHDFKKYRGYENAIKSDIYLNKRAPFINEFYTAIYASGLLYSLANTTTNQNFNFPHVGFGLGLRFYNALDFNLMLGFPIVKDQKFGNNAFIGVGFDIPLSQYLEALGNK